VKQQFDLFHFLISWYCKAESPIDWKKILLGKIWLLVEFTDNIIHWERVPGISIFVQFTVSNEHGAFCFRSIPIRKMTKDFNKIIEGCKVVSLVHVEYESFSVWCSFFISSLKFFSIGGLIDPSITHSWFQEVLAKIRS
jgi:hypothetical protein